MIVNFLDENDEYLIERGDIISDTEGDLWMIIENSNGAFTFLHLQSGKLSKVESDSIDSLIRGYFDPILTKNNSSDNFKVHKNKNIKITLG